MLICVCKLNRVDKRIPRVDIITTAAITNISTIIIIIERIIVPFHKDFSPSGKQLELCKLAHEL